MESHDYGVSIIIPTLNGGLIFEKCLQAINRQEFHGGVQLIVVDSGSVDKTKETAIEFGAKVIEINPGEFNHSRTRYEALKWTHYDNVVYMVQDAIPCTTNWLSSLVSNLRGDIVAVYGQQIPHENAGLYAKFEVGYFGEYLGKDRIVQFLQKDERLDLLSYEEALRRIRFDNVCSIYKREVLNEIPFPYISYGEDIAWAKEALVNGYKILYNPEVQVRHSHDRPPSYRFRRAIVESIACAKILSRVKDDMSFLTLYDLKLLSKRIETLAYIKHNNINSVIDCAKDVDYYRFYFAKTLRSLPVLRHFVSWAIRRGKPNDASTVNIITKMLNNHIDFVVGRIKLQFPDLEFQVLHECIDQVVASFHGRILGEVYASYELKSGVPADISNYIEPYLTGV